MCKFFNYQTIDYGSNNLLAISLLDYQLLDCSIYELCTIRPLIIGPLNWKNYWTIDYWTKESNK